MTSSAISSLTGETVQAKDVRKSPNRVNEGWKCPVCGAEMAAVACGAGSYKVSPHFRAIKGHASFCDAEGKEMLTTSRGTRKSAVTRSMVGDAPKELRLPRVRRKRDLTRQPLDTADNENTDRGRRTAEAAEGTHGSIVTSITPLAEFYCDNPEQRDEPLKITGFPRGSYRSLFEKLSGSEGYRNWPRKILFAPIRFRGARINDDRIIVHLNRPIHFPRNGAEKQRKSEYYRIEIIVSEWSQQKKNHFWQELNKNCNQQEKNYQVKSGDAVYVFFLAEQDGRDLSKFVHRDYRSICFLNLEKHVADRLNRT